MDPAQLIQHLNIEIDVQPLKECSIAPPVSLRVSAPGMQCAHALAPFPGRSPLHAFHSHLNAWWHLLAHNCWAAAARRDPPWQPRPLTRHAGRTRIVAGGGAAAEHRQGIMVLRLRPPWCTQMAKRLLGPRWDQSLRKHYNLDLTGKTLMSVADWKIRATGQ